MTEVKDLWRKLFAKEPPLQKRTMLEARLSYRIQELAYGGLKPSTIARLEAMADEVAPAGLAKRKAGPMKRPQSLGPERYSHPIGYPLHSNAERAAN